MAFSAVKVAFSWSPAWLCPVSAAGRGITTLRPQLHLTLHFFSEIIIEKLIQTLNFIKLQNDMFIGKRIFVVVEVSIKHFLNIQTCSP